MIKFLLSIGSRRRVLFTTASPPIPVRSVGDALLFLHRFEGTLAQLLLQIVVDCYAAAATAFFIRSARVSVLLVAAAATFFEFFFLIGRGTAAGPGFALTVALLMLLVFLVLLDMLLVFFVFLLFGTTVRLGGTSVRGRSLLFVLAAFLLGAIGFGVAGRG